MNRQKNNLDPHVNASARRVGLNRTIVLGLLAGLLGTPWQARAAGGHHAVDDAALLEPRQCQIETWFDREPGGARSLLHAGPACRIGAVELGLNVDRVRLGDGQTTTGFGPQIKWAEALSERWSAGVVLSVAGQDRTPGFLGGALVIPVTWRASETLLAHLNVGRDFRHREPDGNRAGVALEWAPLESWSFVAERYRESSANYWRAGARWALTSTVNVDLSRASGMGGGPPAWWTLGLTWVFGR